MKKKFRHASGVWAVPFTVLYNIYKYNLILKVVRHIWWLVYKRRKKKKQDLNLEYASKYKAGCHIFLIIRYVIWRPPPDYVVCTPRLSTLSYLPNTSYRWLRHANILEKMFLSYELTSIVNYLGSQPNYHQSVFLFMHLSSMKIFARNLIFPLQTMLLITSIILSNYVNVQVWLIFLASVNRSVDAASRRILAWMSR